MHICNLKNFSFQFHIFACSHFSLSGSASPEILELNRILYSFNKGICYSNTCFYFSIAFPSLCLMATCLLYDSEHSYCFWLLGFPEVLWLELGFLLWLLSKKTLIFLFWLFQLYTGLHSFIALITMLLVLLSFSLSLKVRAFILNHGSAISVNLGRANSRAVHCQEASVLLHCHRVGGRQSMLTLASFHCIRTIINMPVLPDVGFTGMDAY